MPMSPAAVRGYEDEVGQDYFVCGVNIVIHLAGPYIANARRH